MLSEADRLATSASFAQAIRLTAAFYSWEERGRGWQVWPHPVELEPAFRSFVIEPASGKLAVDDARKPTLLGRWLARLTRSVSPAPAGREEFAEPEPEAASDF